MRAIGFNAGIRGDLIISTVAARAFKQQHPGGTLTLGMNYRFADMAPLFYRHPHFDDIHGYEGYDDWPTKADEAYLDRARYDIVFGAMPKRPNGTESSWFQWEHQAGNVCSIYGLPYPSDGLQCHLNRWFEVPDYSGYIALNYVGAFYAGYPNNKSYTPDQARDLVRLIRKKGYKVIVLGDPREPALEDTERCEMSYFDSVRTMLGCRALVGVDSGLLWCASAYSHPALASYGSAYYGDRVAAIQPINPAARYVAAPTIGEISLDSLAEGLQYLGI